MFAGDPGEQWTPAGSVHKSPVHFPHPDEACKPSSSLILTQLSETVGEEWPFIAAARDRWG